MIEDMLRRRGDWLGASCVVRYNDEGFVFAGDVCQETLLLSGIGGKVEPGESFRSAALREFEEETGTLPDALVPAPPRHLTVEAREVPVPDGAAALVATRPPMHPMGGRLWIAVFLGVLSQHPRPVEKISHFVLVAPSAFPALGADLAPDIEALRVFDGAELREAATALPGVRHLQATDTARAVFDAADTLTAWWRFLDTTLAT